MCMVCACMCVCVCMFVCMCVCIFSCLPADLPASDWATLFPALAAPEPSLEVRAKARPDDEESSVREG